MIDKQRKFTHCYLRFYMQLLSQLHRKQVTIQYHP